MKLLIQTILYNSENVFEDFLNSLIKSIKILESSISLKIVVHDKNFKFYEDRLKLFELDFQALNADVCIVANENIGFGAGHNWLFKKYFNNNFNIVLLTNPDIVFREDALVKSLEFIKSLDKWGLLDLRQSPNEHPKIFDFKTGKNNWCSGACLFINPKAFQKVNGFDENFFMYVEDVDLSWRIKNEGFFTYTAPNIFIEHKIGESTKEGNLKLGEPSEFTYIHSLAGEKYLYKKYNLPIEEIDKKISRTSKYSNKVNALFDIMNKNLEKIIYDTKKVQPENYNLIMNKKRVLILSVAHIPTKTNKTVEGGGIRAWRLSKGLQLNNLDVTVAIPYHYDLVESNQEGVKIIKWEFSQEFKEKMNSFDTVIMQYTRGDLSDYVIKNLSDNVQLVLDMYVPIYIEVSARDSDDKLNEYTNFINDVNYWNNPIKRADIFLYASDNQEHYYRGVLSALGRLNPITYRKDNLIKLPLGIDIESPLKDSAFIEDFDIDKNTFVLMWYGSFYPWYDTSNIIDSIVLLQEKGLDVKLVVVGAKNPFNDRKEFVQQYEDTYNRVKELGILDKYVKFIPWGDYELRNQWFNLSSVIISLNTVGNENLYSWRTRYIDYIWGDVVMITNGGDAVSDMLIEQNSAIKLENISVKGIVEKLEFLISKPEVIKKVRLNLAKIQDNLRIDNVSKVLANEIINNTRAEDLKIALKNSTEKALDTLEFRFNNKFFKKLARILESIDLRGLKGTIKFLLKK